MTGGETQLVSQVGKVVNKICGSSSVNEDGGSALDAKSVELRVSRAELQNMN